MNKTVYIVLRLVFVFTLMIGVNISAAEKEPTVRIGYLNIVASLPLFIAEEMGFLKNEGLNYETIATATSNQLVDGVIAGNLDCYIESSAVPVLAVELQSPGKLKVFSVSEITPEKPFDSLLVKKDSPIKLLSNLQGKKIGVFPGSTATNLLKKYLKSKRINVSSITFVPMPPPNLLPALINGAVDVIHAYEPTTAIAMSKKIVQKLHGSVYAEMISPNPQGIAVISTSFMQKHPETAAKVIKAFEKAMSFMKKHDADTRKILVKRMKLTEDAAKRCVFLYMLPHNKINTTIFQQYSDMLTDLGELSGQVKIEDIMYRE